MHHWLVKGARITQYIDPQSSCSLIEQTVRAKGGEVVPHEIWKAINKARQTQFSGSGGHHTRIEFWPEADLEAINQVTREQTGGLFDFELC